MGLFFFFSFLSYVLCKIVLVNIDIIVEKKNETGPEKTPRTLDSLHLIHLRNLVMPCRAAALIAQVALSALCRFQHLLVLSNAQDQYFPKSSLWPLPNVQGVAYLLPPCPQPAVLRPCMCLSESLNMFASSWLKMASPDVSIGLRQLNIACVDHFTYICCLCIDD